MFYVSRFNWVLLGRLVNQPTKLKPGSDQSWKTFSPISNGISNISDSELRQTLSLNMCLYKTYWLKSGEVRYSLEAN